MGLLDRVKQVAGEAAEVAKKGASQVQSKVEQTQVRRRADEAAKQLGYAIYRERHGDTAAGGEIDRLLADIEAAEDELERMAAEEAARAEAGEAVRGPEVPPPAPRQAAEEATGE